MKAMVLRACADLAERPDPLAPEEVPVPEPGPSEILLRITACGVCRTELDEIEGRAAPPALPRIPGHQVVGRVAAAGGGAARFSPGDRVGVGWIFSACGACGFCRRGLENLCPSFRATGMHADGGYAEFMTVREDFAHPIPGALTDSQAAPLLCAGAVGYRALRLAGLRDGAVLGLSGFGASAHLVLRLACRLLPSSPVFVFSRSRPERDFALELGASWAGAFGERAPAPCDAVIDTTPAWLPVRESLAALAPGGRLVVNALRKEPSDREALLGLDYASHLWMEREIRSVANVTRNDISEFLSVAAGASVLPDVTEYALGDANRALRDLKAGALRGAKVLRM